MENLNHIQVLFNAGKLKLSDAYWYGKCGYEIVCRAGKALTVTPPEDISRVLTSLPGAWFGVKEPKTK